MGLQAHRSKLVRTYVKPQRGRFVLGRLPAYVPELNPVGYVWAHLKHHAMANYCAADLSRSCEDSHLLTEASMGPARKRGGRDLPARG
jgi:transposase